MAALLLLAIIDQHSAVQGMEWIAALLALLRKEVVASKKGL